MSTVDSIASFARYFELGRAGLEHSATTMFVSPRSASTGDRAHGRIIDLFCDKLRHYLAGEPLQNVLDTERLC